MMLRALFDEMRRAEIRDALKSNRPIEFRVRLPEAEAPAEGTRKQTILERLETIGKLPQARQIHARISQALAKAYGASGHVPMAWGLGLDSAIVSMRIRERMAKATAAPEDNEKPKEVKPEESGKNQ